MPTTRSQSSLRLTTGDQSAARGGAAAHTPGPWKAALRPLVVIDQTGRAIASLPRQDQEAIATARLIAAAPEMYAVLQEVVEFLRDPDIPFPPALHDQITTALHKAVA